VSRGRPQAIELAGSARGTPEGANVVGEIDRDAPLAVTVHFRRRTPPPPPPGSAKDLARLMRPMTRHALERQRARTHARAAARITAFARGHGIAVRDIDFGGRRMVLEAQAGLLLDMFGADVRIYDDGTRRFRARTGALRIPHAIAPWTRAVVGFDQRPLLQGGVGDAANGLWSTEIAALYGIPLDRDVTHQCAGIIAMGGGYQSSDLNAALTAMGRKPPIVIDQSVGGVTNQFGGGDNPADEEIALDLQVLAALLPGARIVVYFTGNTAEALANAIDQAVRDDVNRPQVLSISWGSPESFWTAPRREVVSAALCDAARLGVSAVTAAGDQLATSGLNDGKAHVWFPASSPYVLGCGGTAVTLTGSVIATETVWKQGPIGTGGGISELYPVPDFQLAMAIPPSFNDGHAGRGVPDVAALAADSPGYRIVVGGAEMAKDGTSAATPLWAALLTMANAARSTPLGLVSPQLYRISALLRGITNGDNRQGNIGYAAGPGWNACTGLGVPRGAEIIAALAAVPMA
jgi:kumamolisin